MVLLRQRDVKYAHYCNLWDIKAVSYTHLDVYKRQSKAIPSASGKSMSLLFSFITKTHTRTISSVNTKVHNELLSGELKNFLIFSIIITCLLYTSSFNIYAVFYQFFA